MNKEDKQRVIGKVVAINSDRFTIELLTGIDNFNINGFDDIHYFAQLNSYVILPYQDYYIVAEVAGVKEKDMNVSFQDPKEQFLNKSISGKFLEVLPIGTLKPAYKNSGYSFEFGVSVYPALYTDSLYIKEKELDAIFNIDDEGELICNEHEWVDSTEDCPHGQNKRHKALSIGQSTIFPDYDVKIDIDKFFGSHSAVLGNTGSGKSCTISSILQGLFRKVEYSATGSTFVFFDVNGEYKQAFSNITEVNNSINVKHIILNEPNKMEGSEDFYLPSWMLTIDEWALLLQASEKTQLPILRNALGIAVLFSENDDLSIERLKNHIIATCIAHILRDESGSPSKKDRITSILQRFNSKSINLDVTFSYDNNGHSETWTVKKCIQIRFGEMQSVDALIYFLSQKDVNDMPIFLIDQFEMPVYKKDTKFLFEKLESAIDLAILFEEAHGNRQIRDYCSSMVTRVKSLRDRSEFDFIKKEDVDISKYKQIFLGLTSMNSHLIKETQIIILDLGSVDDEIVEIVSCVISRMIYETVKKFEPRNSYPVNLILEEAHRYISTDPHRPFLKANRIFESIAKEGRKFGMFLLISSQRPSELSRTVLSQCSNFIVHRIQNPDDLSHIRQITPHISDTILKRMPSIPTQHALIFGHSVNLPTTFKVNIASPLPLSDNNKISKNWFKMKNHIVETNTLLIDPDEASLD